MWAEGKVRIVDIADELGVSTATVSNVIHGKTNKVSAATIERVQRKLQERGYLPDMAATLLAQNNARIIGVVIKDHEKYEGQLLCDPFVSSALNCLADEIERAGWSMMLKKTQEIMDSVPFASMWNMDGMVLLSFCAADYQRLRDAIRIPFVVYDGVFRGGERLCNIEIDDFDGGMQVGSHFRESGRSEILYIADNETCMDLARYEGLCSGVGFKADFLHIPDRKQERMAFYSDNIAVLRSHSAIFAASDYYAIELMQFLQRQGIRVPRDLAIAGFDDGIICQQVVPTLTSVRQDPSVRAKTAVSLLQKMKADPSFSTDMQLPVELIVRDSTRSS